MAGLGEACTHVASLLFAVDSIVKVRDSKTVTEEKAYWLLPSPLKNVEYKEIRKIDFTSANKRKKSWMMQFCLPPYHQHHVLLLFLVQLLLLLLFLKGSTHDFPCDTYLQKEPSQDDFYLEIRHFFLKYCCFNIYPLPKVGFLIS